MHPSRRVSSLSLSLCMSALCASMGLAASLGCVPVRQLPLSKTATAESGGLVAQTNEVAASQAFLSQRGGGPSMFAATITLTNRGDATVIVELGRATLVLSDPGAELADHVISAVAGGSGPVPVAVPLRDDAIRAVALAPREVVTVWMAFRNEEPLVEPELPRKIALVIPVQNGTTVSVALADPATGRPRWNHPPIRRAGYGGLSVLTNFDEGSFGVLRGSSKYAAGPVVLGPSVSFGVRGGRLRGEAERTIACCDMGLGFDVSFPFRMQRVGSVGPYLSYQAAFALESGRIDKAAWHGPAAGLQFFSRLIEPNTARALPIRTEPTSLGYSSFTIAYAHLFRRGESGGEPGMLLLFEQSIPEW